MANTTNRTIYKVEKQHPWDVFDIATGSKVSKLDGPPSTICKKAAHNGWWIERKIYAAGTTKAGQPYWQFIKDPSSVSNLVGVPISTTSGFPHPINTSGSTPKKTPIKQTRTAKVWGERDFAAEAKKYASKSITSLLVPENKPVLVPDISSDTGSIVNFIKNSYEYKPNFMKMAEPKWKLLVRSALRGENIILLGDKGEGKTMTAHALANALDRPLFKINFGHMQDAQTALIGKTHLDTGKGTFFSKSYFVEAITTPNAIVLMDELSRATDDAFNIVMTVLDMNQRYLRLNDEVNSPKVDVAPGVCFIATANIGHEYTSTRTFDAALLDRFSTKIEVDRLGITERQTIIEEVYPVLTPFITKTIADIANTINKMAYDGNGEISVPVSTRTCLAIAALVFDGLTLLEAIEHTIYPEYSEDGDTSSERTNVRQIVQGKVTEEILKDKQIYKSQPIEEVEFEV